MYRASTADFLALPTPKRSNQQSPQRLKCIDAGSEFCPCHLAESGECIVCSIIRGEAKCDCDWTGTCILAQSEWLIGQSNQRESQSAKIISRKNVGQGTEILHIQTTAKLAAQLTRPGSFVFVRGKLESYYNTPLAVIKSFPRRNEIAVAYTKLGPKTKTLAACEDELWLRGPYWNGILGHKYIENVYNQRVVLILSGMAQVCGPNIARTLLRNGNKITLVYGAKDYPFIIPYIQEIPSATFVNLKSQNGKQEISNIFRRIRPYSIFSGGCDEQHTFLKQVMSELRLKPRMATSSTHKMCCGEGICGACITNRNGTLIRACKTCLTHD
ncbi:sulfide/dihydroorotate dehydrogenase-like FAD/NAD-binding protein [Maridesulfovibrio salexigens]|uniref:NAD(P)H-flavin reductase n=1 Tax=Maridesulfovibrio salexigens (strain ATCC 14822 / DSM 2638 / NCIMB 8403 / VKM B-1763) TaxID=526222 RepID=C6BUC4_MARSD|nr:sulfide/dihydroorotate dehydrogenase-like FAD/NAD-binding protein [Maridesulfovibrio salexigens]ACS79933.1 hypothetical protein Desal_1872 [Maridesulfovibrio salexigens DSM 2638]